MPAIDTGSYPGFRAVTVYVSGISETNTYLPAAFVTADELCDGLVTVTVTLASGALLASPTVPLKPPVVPASAGIAPPASRTHEMSAATSTRQLRKR